MPLPFHEFSSPTSKGYNGLDIFSPEMDYSLQTPVDLAIYLTRVNQLLAAKGKPAVTATQLTGQDNQLKAFIDLCHIFGIAVIADVVYNHAGGGWSWGDGSIWYYDFQVQDGDKNALFFSTTQESGGLVFDYSKPEVCNYLINNAKSMYDEFHIDGFRYDQVTIIAVNGGWGFAQSLTSTLRFMKPQAVQIAEYWDYEVGSRWKGIADPPYGMGFDLGYGDAIRKAVRNALYAAAIGAGAFVNFDDIKAAIYVTYSDTARWKVFQSIENHDLEDDGQRGTTSSRASRRFPAKRNPVSPCLARGLK
jgi:1,4-alpha-glucan branching enzyme